MDSDDDLFLTHSKFSQVPFNAEDINSDFEQFLDSDDPKVDFNSDLPKVNFNLIQQEKCSNEIIINSSDEELVRSTQGFDTKEFILEQETLGGSVHSSDEELVQCTQEFDTRELVSNRDSHSKTQIMSQNENASPKEPITSRFGKPLTEDELTNLESSAQNRNTIRKSQWAFRTFDSWYRVRHSVEGSLDHLVSMGDDELNNCLIAFITEVRNQKGSEYHGNTLHEILFSLQYVLRNNGRDVNLNTDFEFAGLRRILDAKMKQLAQSGIGIHKRKADVLTPEQEDILWEKGILGDDTPQKLLDTIFYLNGICFCLRGGEEHHSLKVGERGNFTFVQKNGVKHLKYSEGVSKTNSGGLKHKSLTMKTVVVGPNLDKPQRCPVRLHEKYMALRPQSCNAFYLRPLRYPKSDVWYCASPLGRQTLGGIVRRLCDTAGFQGYFTNHSLRATVATRLYESGIDEQLIAERTGHRSSAIRGYKRTSEDMLEMVDSLVQRKKPFPTPACSTVSSSRSAGSSLPGSSTDLSVTTTPTNRVSYQSPLPRRAPCCTVTSAEPLSTATTNSISNSDTDKVIHFTVERSGAKVTFQM